MLASLRSSGRALRTCCSASLPPDYSPNVDLVLVFSSYVSNYTGNDTYRALAENTVRAIIAQVGSSRRRFRVGLELNTGPIVQTPSRIPSSGY